MTDTQYTALKEIQVAITENILKINEYQSKISSLLTGIDDLNNELYNEIESGKQQTQEK